LRHAEVEGNTALNPKRIQTIIFTWGRYKPRKMKKNLGKIQGLYKKKGYVRARVHLQKETYEHDKRKVDVDIGVRQGKRVFVDFEGNKHFWNKTLNKKVTIYEAGDFDEYELDASKTQIANFYKERGYEDVKVEWEKEKLD
jgi:outer membrane protein assembly factor BamA